MKKMKLFLIAGTTLLLLSKNTKSQDVTYQYPASSTKVQLPQPFEVTYLDEDSEYLRFKIEVSAKSIIDADLSVNVRNEGRIFAVSFKDTYREEILRIAKKPKQELEFRLSMGDNVYTKKFKSKTYNTENTLAIKL